ncbi:hypothetical protein K503DRAFT_870581 [Rhizopogon vinicolor AM-OR11-026]|uniref:GH3 middle domain-containing protein n=1 Tax=Rhizopogon vinicolor AM-OR11-026 TaxID=1314800 RepID=A0A1B7MG51_9AGAM|nr:hypothetical protein K503DRAFT_870581 [Rhizopogon vinicolor AM-OR11-026]
MLSAANIRLHAFNAAPPDILFCVSLPADLSSLLPQSLTLFVPQQTWNLALELIPDASHILFSIVRPTRGILQGSDAQLRLCFRFIVVIFPAIDLKIVIVNQVIEFVDWELAKGRHYQPILTTRDGLWRYRSGDVIAVKCFASDDGMPVINYMHRRDDSSFGTCTESELTSAIISTAKRWNGQITEFTVIRDKPFSFGYLVEIEGEIGSSLLRMLRLKPLPVNSMFGPQFQAHSRNSSSSPSRELKG